MCLCQMSTTVSNKKVKQKTKKSNESTYKYFKHHVGTSCRDRSSELANYEHQPLERTSWSFYSGTARCTWGKRKRKSMMGEREDGEKRESVAGNTSLGQCLASLVLKWVPFSGRT